MTQGISFLLVPRTSSQEPFLFFLYSGIYGSKEGRQADVSWTSSPGRLDVQLTLDSLA